jgi:hypothetical protein
MDMRTERLLAFHRASIVAAICVASALGLAVESHADSSRSDSATRCRPAHTTTVAQTKSTRVFRSTRYKYPATFACLFSRYRAWFLDEPTGSLARGPFVLNGRYIAYVTEIAVEEAGPYRFFLRVVDASRHDRVRRQFARSVAGAALDPRPDEQLPTIARIALTARGHLAWSHVTHGTNQLLLLDAAGSRLLDQGPGADVYSLRLCQGNHSACWTSNGESRSAALD